MPWKPSPHDVALLVVLSDPSVAHLFGLNEWVETAKPQRIGIVDHHPCGSRESI